MGTHKATRDNIQERVFNFQCGRDSNDSDFNTGDISASRVLFGTAYSKLRTDVDCCLLTPNASVVGSNWEFLWFDYFNLTTIDVGRGRTLNKVVSGKGSSDEEEQALKYCNNFLKQIRSATDEEGDDDVIDNDNQIHPLSIKRQHKQAKKQLLSSQHRKNIFKGKTKFGKFILLF